MNDNLDTPVFTEEELAAYSILRQAFAASFFRRQLARYKESLPSAVKDFTKWWNGCINGFSLFNETQQEFDRQSFAACDVWLERWIKQQAQAMATGKIETPPQDKQEQEVARIRASWGISTADAKRISKTIRQGVKKFVPELRNKSVTWAGTSLLFPTGTVISSGESDAIQDAWVKLLTGSTDGVNGPAAHSAGGTAARQMVREEAHLTPISQLQTADPEAPEVTLDGVQKGLTDEDYRHTDESKVESALGAVQDAIRLAILAQFRGEAPDDYDFIVSYLDRVERVVLFRGGRRVSISKRGAKPSPEERTRAKDIMKKLRRWEEMETESEK